MPHERQNPYSVPRLKRKVESRDLTDSGHPGLVVTFTLRKPDVIDQSRGAVLASEMIGRYIHSEDGTPTFPFMVDEEVIPLTPLLVDQFCTIAVMQPSREELGYDPYSPEDIAQWAFRCPDLWLDLCVFYREVLNRREEADSPNSEAPTPLSSVSA